MADVASALADAQSKMDKAVEVAKDDFATIRTGRAHPALFNKIMVDYYGTYTPLSQLASIQVPEARMAIVMAQLGGIGVLHRNLSIEEQCAAVRQVKRFESGMVVNPITIAPEATLAEAQALMLAHAISGIPVVEASGKLAGILTNRDVRFAENPAQPVSELMTHENLATVASSVTQEEARRLLHQRRIEKLLVVDDAYHCIGLITVKDIEKAVLYPNATKDGTGRLRVAAATTVGEKGMAYTKALIDAECDLIVVDTAHGHSAMVAAAVAEIKRMAPEVQVVAGNVATAAATRALIDAGADGIKVGIGPGSICTTRVVAGAGMPQLSAIWHTAQRAKQLGIPLIADGGVTYSGDLVKAFAAGATVVMLGSLLAGTDEAPGEVELFEGRRYKSYRGMGSLGAMQGLGADRYGSAQGDGAKRNKLVPEGIEGRVAYAGSITDVIYQLVGGLRSGMGYAGAANLADLHARARFMRVTTAGREESHPHDVTITHEAPNYHSS